MTTASNVNATTSTTPSDRELVAVRVVDAPRKLVWDGDKALATGMKEGWSKSYDRLDEHLRTMA
jgi:uncharacterized protein YndB with AHSA1/START domain